MRPIRILIQPEPELAFFIEVVPSFETFKVLACMHACMVLPTFAFLGLSARFEDSAIQLGWDTVVIKISIYYSLVVEGWNKVRT